MAYEVLIKELPPERLATTRGVYAVAEIGQVMGREFGRVMAALSAQGLYPLGGPVALYHAWPETTVDVEIGFPVPAGFREQDGVRPSELPGGRVATTVFVGPYDQIEAAYVAVQEYANESGLSLAETMWERYLTDPAQEPDLSKHVTEVFWPLA